MTLSLNIATFTRLIALNFLLSLVLTQRAEAQLFIANSGSGKVGSYTTSGTSINANLITGLGSPTGIAVSGSNLYVVNSSAGTIGAYTTSGTTVNASLLTGLGTNALFGLAVSGSGIYVVNNSTGKIGAYTTSGSTVNANLISGLSGPTGIAVSGSNIYVANFATGTIGVYTTSGVTVNANLITGLSLPYGVAVFGANIYVVNLATNSVGVYTTSGSTVNASLITGLNNPVGIAATGSRIYVANYSGNRVSEYTTSGVLVNANLITGLNRPFFIALQNDDGFGAVSGVSTSTSTPSNILAGTSVGLNDLGVTANPVLAGGTLVLNKGDSSSVSIAITSAGGTIQAPTSGSAILSGVFSGSGGLTFTSSAGTVGGGTGGTAVLSGANTYSGGTTVSGGTLSVAGASPTGTGDVFVASAGTLMGTGTIAGNGIVSGVLKPGNSPGYLSFTQNLTLNSGSTYQQDIAGATQASSATPVGASGYYSFVNVGSQLTIQSGATLTPRLSNLFNANEVGYGSNIYVPVLGDKFRIITAGGITGRFTTLTQPAELGSGTQFIAFYNVNSSNSLDLVTVPTSYSTTLSSSTTNAKSVASVLDQLLGLNKAGTVSSAQDSLLYSIAGQSAANLPDFARSLAGEIHAASAATLPQTTQRVQQSVLARLSQRLRQGS